MKISDYVKIIRSHLKLTQKQFGDKIGKTRCSVANYETDRAIPPGDVLLKIQELELLYPSIEKSNQQAKSNPTNKSINE